MLDIHEICKAIAYIRRTGDCTQTSVVSEGLQTLSKSLTETISAFANTTGGLILVGLSKENGFKPAPGFDVENVFAQLQIVGQALTPKIQMAVKRISFEGSTVVAAYVPPVPVHQKPCFITRRGLYGGAFIRSGAENRCLLAYEVDRLVEARIQPMFDLEPVERATVEDLKPETLNTMVTCVRELYPRVFGRLDKLSILIQLGVLTRLNDTLRPTLAGLLVAGIYPQQFFPRLEVVLTVYPGKTKVSNPSMGHPYLDSKEFVGSIPDMLTDCLSFVKERLSTGTVNEGGLRNDVLGYSLLTVQKALVNALQHRDYSPQGRGTWVQVNLFADRLEIANPGGLYGATTVESLGKGISSTRNTFLSRLLAYTPYQDGFVAHNVGTGFRTIESTLASNSMPPLKVENTLSLFRVTFEKRQKTPMASK